MDRGDGEQSSSGAQRGKSGRWESRERADPQRKMSGSKRREGRSRSRLMSERANVQKQFSAADGEPGESDTLTWS